MCEISMRYLQVLQKVKSPRQWRRTCVAASSVGGGLVGGGLVGGGGSSSSSSCTGTICDETGTKRR